MATFVGFGFGPIQAGLFLAEAFSSGNFTRLVVAEIVPEVVAAVRQAGGFTVNIGHADRISALTVGPVEIYAPGVPVDREQLVQAVAAASEIATALPSVVHYVTGGDSGVHAILAEGCLRKVECNGPLAVVYAAENHARAADLLAEAVLAEAPAGQRDPIRRRVQFLDTIIGKMSGAPEETADLHPVVAGLKQAFLVEAFNRIYISQIQRPSHSAELDPAWADYRRGIEVFVEQPDLTPFAEAKLYCHNAGHALAAYLAHCLGLRRIDELRQRPDILEFVRSAMLEESGAPLLARFGGVDPLFTPAGMRAYVDDLVERMVNPYVRDAVARVGRDPARKLGWEDRLVGAMRLALNARVKPRRYALGVAAALRWLELEPTRAHAYLCDLWGPLDPPQDEQNAVLACVTQACEVLQDWERRNYPNLV
jgi:mannitol-1-phosphate 5-dehydrogenase